jgi:peptidoglycan/LPS O-acetylase OafA/YrhL
MKLVHNNNFELIRFSLATLVIVLHSFDLLGFHYTDYLSIVTHGQITLPYIIIRGFVIMSGYLVLKSLIRSTSIKQYLWRRFLRIYPPLLVALLLWSFVIGPFLTTLSLEDYFAHSDVWRHVVYSFRIFMVKRTECLPGVFSNNPTGCAVNGSLWTIWVEEFLYILLIGLFFIRKKKKLLNLSLVVIALSLFLFNTFILPGFKDVPVPLSKGIGYDYFMNLFLYFFSGCLLTLFSWKNMKLNRILLAISLAATVLTCYLGIYEPFGYVLYPVIMVTFGSDCIPSLLKMFRFGNPSYGLYIYAYPIQQMLIQLYAPSPWQLVLMSVPLSLIVGYASWHLIEVPFLSLKERVK